MNGVQVLVLLASLEAKDKGVVCDLLVIFDFSEVFHEDIIVLSPEREVEFSIDLVPEVYSSKGGIQGLPSEFLVAQATVYGKAMSEDAFEAIFVLLIYGLVLFPNIDKFVDVNAIRIFSVLNPVPILLGDTYFSLHLRNVKGSGAIV
ncbi:hypothetical protein KIW84_034745 [Lathyrus oleraceus]|uniref:DUF7745 domain-containing protein n=1 Tax=Pisum sativum TaxID=3888 RepID=A0A9D4Y4Q8_PEA|nr:hypothetical protein KIW84_034745 [Pisum sativum]